MDAPIKLIAYMSYSTLTGALVVSGSRNCSGFYNVVGDVRIRVGPPGPLSNVNTPAGVTTEWSRAITNLLPCVVCGTALRMATVAQGNDTTYTILTFNSSTGAAADSAVWFALYQIAV